MSTIKKIQLKTVLQLKSEPNAALCIDGSKLLFNNTTSFQFGSIYTPERDHIFENFEGQLDKCVNGGKNALTLAYGASGSGKVNFHIFLPIFPKGVLFNL